MEAFLRAGDVAERAAGGGARFVGRHPLFDQAGGFEVDVGADFPGEVVILALLG